MDPTSLKELLERCNIEICPFKKILICRTCPIVLTSKLKAHLKTHHSILISSTENEMLQKCIIHDSKYLSPTKELLEPVFGFPITIGHVCKYCVYYTGYKSVLLHHNSVHHEGKEGYRRCHVQRLFSKGENNYVGVIADAAVEYPKYSKFHRTKTIMKPIKMIVNDSTVKEIGQEDLVGGLFAVEVVNSGFP